MDPQESIFEKILDTSVNVLERVIDSGLLVALCSSLAGAFFGAFAAHKIMKDSRIKEDFEKEIISINSAITISFTISQILLSLKKQHVLPLYSQHRSKTDEYNKLQKGAQSGYAPEAEPYNLGVDLRKFMPSLVPIESLKEISFNRLNLSIECLRTLTYLEATISDLKESIAMRNSLIEDFKNYDKIKLRSHYFGLMLESGNIDKEYPDTIDAIKSYCDDSIFFSILLCKELIEHGTKTMERSPLKNNPQLVQVTFGQGTIDNLIPPDRKYQDWLNRFSTEK